VRNPKEFLGSRKKCIERTGSDRKKYYENDQRPPEKRSIRRTRLNLSKVVYEAGRMKCVVECGQYP
jgi:hypothetical protein